MRHDFVFAALLPARAPLVQHLFVVFILHVFAIDRYNNDEVEFDGVLSPANTQLNNSQMHFQWDLHLLTSASGKCTSSL
jgi:hypothetical protein